MRTKRGSIIAFSVILLSILLTSGLSVVTVATLEKRSSLSTQKSVVAFQAADSGIERVLKRIYIDNSPSVYTTALNATMPDATLQQVAAGLQGVTGSSCNGGSNKIVATSSNEPAYTFEASFFDGSDVQITCSDTQWRDKVVRLKLEGFYRQTSRVIELGIKPRPICGDSDLELATDEDGNTYELVQIGTQCWMKENMRVGSRIDVVTGQSDNGITEYFCYDDQPSNCSANHPNYPDGGLYTWNEAMQYSTAEGAQGICPDGFHIPTETDWQTLELYAHSLNTFGGCDPDRVGGASCSRAGIELQVGGSTGYEGNLSGYVTSSSPSFSGRDIMAPYWASSFRAGGTSYPAYGASRYLFEGGGLTGYVLKSRFIASPQIATPVRCIKN